MAFSSVAIYAVSQAEIKLFVRPDATVLQQHFEKKLVELEEEKKYLQVRVCGWTSNGSNCKSYIADVAIPLD